MDRLRIIASIEVNTNTIGMEFWMTTDISEKTTKSMLIQSKGIWNGHYNNHRMKVMALLGWREVRISGTWAKDRGHP